MARTKTIPYVWATNAAGVDIADPGQVKQELGWVSEKPPHQFFNFTFNAMSDVLKSAEENGIIEWLVSTNYTLGALTWEAGIIYQSVQANVGQQPSADVGNVYWGTYNPGGTPAEVTTKGRLVKFLTTSGTLTINESADDSVAGYLTSNDIKSGTYLVYAYGGGGGGGRYTNYTGGAGGGGISRSVLNISSSTSYTIGSGGTGQTVSGVGSVGANGGDTTISTITAGGGGYSTGNVGSGIGGTGTLSKGGGGGGGGSANGGVGGGANGGAGCGISGWTGNTHAGLAGGGGGGASLFQGGDGGDGYIEIYEWSV